MHSNEPTATEKKVALAKVSTSSFNVTNLADMTFAVDWALNNNYLSTNLAKAVTVPVGIPQGK